jgi:hypothetical protein
MEDNDDCQVWQVELMDIAVEIGGAIRLDSKFKMWRE